jgi:hypothetical protein
MIATILARINVIVIRTKIMWKKIKATLGLNKAELAEAKALAASEARTKRAEAKADKAKAKVKVLSAKDEATNKGEPWVEIIGMEIDEKDPGQGAFELDWNDIFIAKLVRAGYQGKTDQDIVDNWFKTVCRNVVTETYEQDQADPEKRASRRRDLGDGRTEVS